MLFCLPNKLNKSLSWNCLLMCTSFSSPSILCILWFRIHPLAGTVDPSDPNVYARAEATFVENLKYAADKCAEVHNYIMTIQMVLILSCCMQCNIMVLIEPISTIPNYFLQHQQQGNNWYVMHLLILLSYALTSCGHFEKSWKSKRKDWICESTDR